MITIFGIKNCDTIKRALIWAEDLGLDHQFHDYRRDGLEEPVLRDFVAALGWEALLNKRGTTWRKLSPGEQEGVDEEKAITLMMKNTSLIKRPVWERGGRYALGFAQGKDREKLRKTLDV